MKIKTKKKTKIYLLSLFLAILAVKILLVIPMHGTFIYTDEYCVIQIAKFFIENFQINICTNITGMDAANPSVLYSLIISPIYYFTGGLKAYYIILILNSILVSSLVLPLYGILKKFKIKDYIIFLFSTFLLFIPQILIYEKMLMTETLYTVINIWLLYFYINSFEKNKIRNKIITFCLAILSLFTRPFGFIILLAILINEFFYLKKKKSTTVFFIILFSIICTFCYFLISDYLPYHGLTTKIQSLANIENIVKMLSALKNQFNSFILPVFFIPFILFIQFLFNDKFQKKLKIKFFLISLFLLNFIISSQHIYGYMLGFYDTGEPDPLSLLTRYIHLPIILTILFGFIFLIREKKYILTKTNTIIITILLIPLFFLENQKIKYSLNMDIVIYTQILFKYSIIILYLFLIISLIFQKKKILIFTIFTLIIANSTLGYLYLKKQSNSTKGNTVFEYFKNTDYNILFKKNFVKQVPDFTFYYDSFLWSISSLTNNKIKTYSDISEISDINDYDYIISSENLNYPIKFKASVETVYKIH